MGEAPGSVAVMQAPDVVTVGYSRASPGLAQVARLADHLPWYLHHQAMILPSLPGQSSEVLCHDPHPYPPPHPLSPPPHLPSLHLPPLHLPHHQRHRPFTHPHRRLNQCWPVRPHHSPGAYPHQNHVLSLIRRPTSQ